MEAYKDMGPRQMEKGKEQAPKEVEGIKDSYQVYRDPKLMERMEDLDKGYTDPRWKVGNKQEDRAPRQMENKMDGSLGVKMEGLEMMRG